MAHKMRIELSDLTCELDKIEVRRQSLPKINMKKIGNNEQIEPGMT